LTLSINDIVADMHKETAEWAEEDQTAFFLAPLHGESLIRFHHSLGRHIRNKYNLWQLKWNPEIIDDVDHSPYHPDAVSQIIIEEVWKLGIYTKV
jgi:hypothetical protein